ncbi:hypothetical protein SCACP_36900 [Sporomusa carbonis]|uniref:transposase n=1 Tax=Sporomusa carbonis TaxID=3076075 RepID=UPI003A6874D4
MTRKRREKSNSGYYHIMIRGNERKSIFFEDEDRLRFIDILYEKKQGNKFFLHAFCLMDNHVHLMLQEGTEGIANVMKKINISYVYYFNKKYKRVGHLFQDRFKSEVVEDDQYILALIRYIHQNPVKAGIVKSAGEYKWSSYNGYLLENHYFNKVLDTGVILGIFSEDLNSAKKQFKEYVNQDAVETFIDMNEETVEMDEESAKELWNTMLNSANCDSRVEIARCMIKEFKEKTNLSIRKIAAITHINKDRINKILRS